MGTYPVLRVTKRTSEQRIFDAVVEHLRRQGKKSKRGIGTCLYRGPNGTACAVGALLTDNEVKQIKEGSAVRDITLPHRLHLHLDLLARLQLAHDGGTSPFILNEDLRYIARHYNLKFTNPIERWS